MVGRQVSSLWPPASMAHWSLDRAGGQGEDEGCMRKMPDDASVKRGGGGGWGKSLAPGERT